MDLITGVREPLVQMLHGGCTTGHCKNLKFSSETGKIHYNFTWIEIILITDRILCTSPQALHYRFNKGAKPQASVPCLPHSHHSKVAYIKLLAQVHQHLREYLPLIWIHKASLDQSLQNWSELYGAECRKLCKSYTQMNSWKIYMEHQSHRKTLVHSFMIAGKRKQKA